MEVPRPRQRAIHLYELPKVHRRHRVNEAVGRVWRHDGGDEPFKFIIRTAESDELASWVAEKVNTWRFPKPKDSLVTRNQPSVFEDSQ